MTFRDALFAANLNEICRILNGKDQDMEPKKDAPTLEKTTAAYKRVVAELLSKPFTRAYHMHILVYEAEDVVDHSKYADVCLLNFRYVDPPVGFKPWGGNKNLPPNHYNCNLVKYNRTFGLDGTPWSKIIDTPIVNEGGYSLEKTVAEILWELTFYGWTEKKSLARMEEIKKTLTSRMKKSRKK
jgi:hypothetical protein